MNMFYMFIYGYESFSQVSYKPPGDLDRQPKYYLPHFADENTEE